ncbi:tetratricopeptide repeat protein [Alienimonas sp. DA493]|uniref:tetratricopeptide repeat protein n=1 Tax=Alienimonas sp. DA493 TaxID=3373605 RepID=UPI0037547044
MASAPLPAPRRRSPGRLFAALLVGLLAPAALARQDDPPPAAEPAEESPEIARERQIAERFLSLLERNPRPGTALDRAYAFYAERGELAALTDDLRERMKQDAEDAAAPAILGLIEARRGNDDAAIAAFEAAAERAPDDPNPRARLAETLALAGRPGEAAAAYEAALARDPARRDLPDLLAGLGRALTRGGQAEEAAAVWDRLTEQFPGDDAVREQIAAVLEAEGNFDAALARYEALAAETTDDYRRIAFGLKAAGLKVRLGRTDEAVEDFEELLANLNPDSWLYREVRSGIERSFLRTDDLAGLTAYYEGWLEERPEDVAAMSRLGELLDRQNRDAEARRWLERAVEKAPGDGRLRRALISQLLRAGEYAAAAEQFEVLNEQTPGDADTLRDWGAVFLSDPSLPDEQRLAKAKAVWERLLAERGEDPIAVTRVADWLRQAGDAEGAKALYRRAVELAPEDPRYREYLGEYLHVLGESEEAVAVWNELAAGENRGVKTLARLSEVLGGFGYDERAAAAAAEADALDAEEAGSDDPAAGALEFADRMRFAELFSRAGRDDAAEAQIAKAEALAVTAEERRAALNAAIDADEAADRLESRIGELEGKVEANPEDADAHLRLALYRDAAGDAAGAAEAAERAAALTPRDVTALATLSELQERAGRLTDAIAAARRLADADRPRRAEHLMRVAELQLRLGQRAEAMRTAREVVAGAPGNPEALSFLSRVAFRTGDEDAGFDALRRAARTATRDAGPLLALADALADRFRTDEAVELLWRAFVAVDGFDDKAIVVRRLAALAQRQGRFDPFLEKLERLASGDRGAGGAGFGGAGEGPDRETALLLAEAHLAVDDAAAARATLEPLLARDPRDAALLARLATLAETAGDLEDAIGFQRRVVELGDAPAERMRLAGLLTAAGNDAEAEPFFLELLSGQTDPAERVRAIDRLLAAGREGVAFRLADAGLARDGDDWELLTRLALAAVAADDDELTTHPSSLDLPPLRPRDEALDGEARLRIADAALRRVWDLDLPADAPSAAAQAAAARTRSRRAGSTGRTSAGPARPRVPREMLREREVLPGLAQLNLLDSLRSVASGTPRFDPEDYGVARLLAATWLASRDDAFARRVFAEAGVDLRDDSDAPADDAPAPNPDPAERALWDAYHLTTLSQRTNGRPLPRAVRTNAAETVRRLTAALAGRSDAGLAASMAYLNTLRARLYSQPTEDFEPLSAEELDLLERATARLTAEEEAGVGVGYAAMGEGLLLAELERAGETERVRERVAAIVAEADEPQEIRAAAQLLSGANRPGNAPGRPQDLAALLDKARALPPERRAAALPPTNVLVQLAADRTAAGDLEEAFRLLDLHAETAAAAPTGAQRNPAGGAGTAVDAGRRLAVWVPQGNGGFARYITESGFPPPALPIEDEQVALLRSQTMWLAQPNLLAPLRDGDDDGEQDASDPDESTPESAPAERVAPLLAHLESRVETTEGAARGRELLRLACLEAWAGDPEAAVGSLEAALALSPDDGNLRRVVAAAKADRGDAAAGLALLDAVEPTDPDELRQRELLALRTAAGAGDLDRARAAADRLFGLRLSAEEQLELARTMQRLGMGEKAAAVLARMRRSAGNDAQTLSGLMVTHRLRGEDAAAAEIARAVLTRFRPVNLPPNRGRTAAQRQTETAREEAVRTLQALGELEPVLADLRAKLERNPNARTVRDELVAVLNDAGRRDEAVELLRSAGPAGSDPAALVAAAESALARNDSAAAADFYLKALKADPQAVGGNVGQLFQTFKRVDRTAELMAAVGRTNPADWGPYRQMTTYLLQQGANDSDAKEVAVAAFEELWERHPDLREELFARAEGNALMGADGVYDYAVERLLTSDAAAGPGGGRADWDRLSETRSWNNGPITRLHRTLEAAKERGALEELTARIEREREAAPDWQPGRLVLAAVRAAAGDADAAREQVEALRALPQDEAPPGLALWALSIELDRDEELADLALALMERVVAVGATTPWSGNGYNYSPRRRLIDLLIKAERMDEARALLLEQAFDPPEESAPNRGVFQQNPRYLAQRVVQERTQIGRRLAEIGRPLDALRVLDGAVDEATRGGIPGTSWELRELNEAVAEVRKAVTAGDVAGLLRTRLEADRAALAADNPLEPGPTLDLFVAATDGGDDLEDAAIASHLLDALVSPAADGSNVATEDVEDAEEMAEAADVSAFDAPPTAPDAPGPDAPEPSAEEPSPQERAAAVRGLLAEAIELRPDDLSLHAAAALLAFDADAPQAAAPSVTAALRLARSASDAPEPAAVGTWWLVGTEATRHAATAEDGRALTDAALAAADALPRTWLVALRISAGRAALDRGDRAAAEAHWTALLGDLLGRDLSGDADAPPPGESGAALTPGAAPGGGAVGVRGALLIAALAALDDPDAPPSVPVTTGPRARRALRLAQLAAEKGLTDLSLRAVRETLGGGPPLGGGTGTGGMPAAQTVHLGFSSGFMTATGGGGGGIFGGSVAAAAPAEEGGEPLSDTEIAGFLRTLSEQWTQAEADPAAVAATLREVVLPASRPTEAFPYAAGLPDPEPSAVPRDAVGPLIEWTLRADAAAALRERTAGRTAAASAASLIKARLAVAEGDEEAAAAALEELARRAELGGPDAVAALHAALPALHAEVALPAASAALIAGAENFSTEGPPRNFLPLMARVSYRAGDAEAAERYLARSVSESLRDDRSGSRWSTRSALAAAVKESARAGAGLFALERLDELLRLPDDGRTDELIAPDETVPQLLAALETAPADRRFDALLKWTVAPDGLPPGTVRGLEATPETKPADGAVADGADEPAAERSAAAVRPVTGLSVALARTAKEAGRVDELVAALDAADAARAAAPPEERDPEQAGEDGDVVPPDLDAVRAHTLRLLVGAPTDVPAALAAAVRVREDAEREYRAAMKKQLAHRSALGKTARRAFRTNLLLAQAALRAPATGATGELAAELQRMAEYARQKKDVVGYGALPAAAGTLAEEAQAAADD